MVSSNSPGYVDVVGNLAATSGWVLAGACGEEGGAVKKKKTAVIADAALGVWKLVVWDAVSGGGVRTRISLRLGEGGQCSFMPWACLREG